MRSKINFQVFGKELAIHSIAVQICTYFLLWTLSMISREVYNDVSAYTTQLNNKDLSSLANMSYYVRVWDKCEGMCKRLYWTSVISPCLSGLHLYVCLLILPQIIDD